MTFTEIRTAVLDYCSLSSTEATARVGRAVNRHYRRITSTLGLEAARFVTRSATTTNGQQYVTFSEIEKIDRVFDTTASDARLLTEVSIDRQRTTQASQGQPETWALRNTDADSAVILLDTVPQTAYTLQADGWATLADLSGTDEPVFPESFHDILVWAVIAEELLKKEKDKLAQQYAAKAERLLGELRFHLADSPARDTQQGSYGSPFGASGGSGGGSSTPGATAYTQSALLTFDLGTLVAPFAVARTDAPYVANLGAEFLGNITTDRLIGRDTAGTGETEQLTASGGLEFTGTGIQTSAFTGDVTKAAGGTVTTIPAGTVTYAKMQDVSATDKLLGRSTAGSGDVEEITCTAAGRALIDDASAAAQRTTLGVGTADSPTFVATTLTDGQIVFPATQVPSAGANTLDDYEEGTWTPAVGGTATYTTQTGTYTKIGRQVTVNCTLTINSIGSGSASTISGLPFASSARFTGAAFISSGATNFCYVMGETSGSTIVLAMQDIAGDASMGTPASLMGNGTVVRVTITYFV